MTRVDPGSRLSSRGDPEVTQGRPGSLDGSDPGPTQLSDKRRYPIDGKSLFGGKQHFLEDFFIQIVGFSGKLLGDPD